MKTTYDRCGELSDGLGDVGHGLDLLGGDPEPGPVHLLLAELELCRVLEDAVVPQQCEVLGGVGESLSYCWLPEQAVVNLPVYILDMSSDHVEPLVVGIARDMVALGVGQVPVAAERGDEGCKLAALLVKGHRVVPLPGVSDGLVGVRGHCRGLPVGGEDRVGLA